MLSGKLLKTVTAGALLLGLGVTLAYAAADDQIKARQTQMKANGKAMGALAAIMKGEAAYDAAVVKASIDAMGAAWDESMKANAWGADAQTGSVETWAKPEVWSDAEGFKAAGDQLGKALGDLAATTDEAGFKAAFPAVGGGCKNCHDKFRRPKEQ